MRVQQPFPDRVEKRIIGTRGESKGLIEISRRNGIETFLQSCGVCPPPEVVPPDDPFGDHRERREQGRQNRPHDRPALEEIVNDNIGKTSLHEESSKCGVIEVETQWELRR